MKRGICATVALMIRLGKQREGRRAPLTSGSGPTLFVALRSTLRRLPRSRPTAPGRSARTAGSRQRRTRSGALHAAVRGGAAAATAARRTVPTAEAAVLDTGTVCAAACADDAADTGARVGARTADGASAELVAGVVNGSSGGGSSIITCGAGGSSIIGSESRRQA